RVGIPVGVGRGPAHQPRGDLEGIAGRPRRPALRDRKSTRLNSSHSQISYAVFCLKKKKTYTNALYRGNVTLPTSIPNAYIEQLGPLVPTHDLLVSCLLLATTVACWL